MAFCNKVGNVLRQGAARSTQAPVSSMLNYIRCMSSSKLFIGGLSYGVDDQSLKDAFSGFGDVVDAKVITDRDSGRSRGFGFVNFSNDESASSALSAMDGKMGEALGYPMQMIDLLDLNLAAAAVVVIAVGVLAAGGDFASRNGGW
ncbi:hypothetical protein GLYMA_11G255000v4 [Glycine max]|uniref:RRM domain-containing protein n=1 Tax=Glycine max TaxID=3847 RepID=I1LN27_SOYBN|nr:glycine-rich RNA-binding protein 4, mitochondrial-like isoform X1 [Glycine soja]KAH1160834.1 hypothetical protein GYH30_032212 [Glycine max]KHN44478.1 Glycine-rich RNA-binding protein 2, mitochondrial [Glycine soja]KRH31570.1 hypothetical protein GLYMA_11G255000v4 [Glycine max]|eukprot:XP_025980065.1 uncharacterized protein LOC100527220 isoform X1 [Glycine max]